MAPALIVAGFQLFTEGYEAAQHALRPLAFMSAWRSFWHCCLRHIFRRAYSAAQEPPGRANAPAAS